MSFIDSGHNPLPSWLPWFRRIYSRVLLPCCSTSAQNCYVFYRNMHCGFVSGAHHQLSTVSQSSRCPQLSLYLQQGISATRPQQGSEGFSSRVETFRHLFQSWQRCERVLLLVWYFPRYPSFSMDFFILFLLRYAWYARLQNGCCERSGVRRAAPFSHSVSPPSLSHSLSLPQSLVPSPSLLPVLHCTSPPFHFLSLPLLPSRSHRHTEICTSLAFHNYCCATANHVNQEDSPPQIQRRAKSSWWICKVKQIRRKGKENKANMQFCNPTAKGPWSRFFWFFLLEVLISANCSV